jgi:rhodanese-related sulfurtransferase
VTEISGKGQIMANEVSINELEQAIKDGAFVLDVREGWEFENGHVPTAHHIPLGDVPDQLAELPMDAQVWVICQAGGRSMTAANYLESQKFSAVSVAGGTGSWVEAGKHVSTEPST